MAAKKTIKRYRVTTKTDGFRRAGREWRGAVELPDDALTDEQWEQVKSEPQLVVEAVSISPDSADEK